MAIACSDTLTGNRNGTLQMLTERQFGLRLFCYSFYERIVFTANDRIKLSAYPELRLTDKRDYSSIQNSKLINCLILLSYPRRGFFAITSRGNQLLSSKPQDINAKFLERYDEFVQFIEVKKDNAVDNIGEITIAQTPEEILEAAHQKIQENLAKEILEAIKKCSPYFFESLVIDLLVSMGYGGSRKEAGQALKQSRDEGIDGIIKEDRLGLDIIYIQAKRWENNVSRPEIQKFAGALLGQSAKKGIFISTSNFTKGAIDYVTRIDSKIILVDGNRLTELMIEHDVGVTPISKYEVKKIDFDYFIED